MMLDLPRLFKKYALEFKGVVHVGAHVGQEHRIYKRLGINNKLYIEANPNLMYELVDRVQGDNVWVYSCAVGEEEGAVTLNLADNGAQSSSILALGTHAKTHSDVNYSDSVKVDMMTLNQILEKVNSEFDLLVMDVQGYEGHVLRGLGERLNQFKAVVTEVNVGQVYKGCIELPEMDEYMNKFNLKRVETTEKNIKWYGWGDALYIKY